MLIPSIYIHWKEYQAKLLADLKEKHGPAALAGDARHDSMGHNAKYGAYSVYSCSSSKVIHFDLVQVGVIIL